MQFLTDLIHGLSAAIRMFADQFGGPGLAVVAALDSSLLSLPEVNDALVVVLALQQPDHWWYYPLFTIAGSVTGCYALYRLGRAGGEALLRRRFGTRRLERGLAVFGRFGPLALIVPSLLPPPVPFKIFVLLAGASGVRTRDFLLSVAIGRGTRYMGQAFLAHRYGPEARDLIAAHLPGVAILAGLVLAGAIAAMVVWPRARPGVECGLEARDA